MLIDRARKLRETPPAGHCPTCYARWCRLLYINHCICTGHITTQTPRPDLTKPINRHDDT